MKKLAVLTFLLLFSMVVLVACGPTQETTATTTVATTTLAPTTTVGTTTVATTTVTEVTTTSEITTTAGEVTTTTEGETTLVPIVDPIEYTFEAEHIDCSNIGSVDGWSGGGADCDIISVDTLSLGASNGFYANYLYTNGVTLTFVITSDRAVSDAKIVARLSAEGQNFTISTSNYTIRLNGADLQYTPIQFRDVPAVGDALDFADYILIQNVTLVAGENTIQLITNNNNSLGGTTKATAPLVDCIKITTRAILTWDPHLENEDLF